MSGVRWGRAALAVPLAALALSGCTGPAPAPVPPVGEIIPGADCLAQNLRYFDGLPFLPEEGAHAPVPLAGTIPDGFRPSRVVLCHLEEGVGGVAVIEELRDGDLVPLLAALAEPSDPPTDGACPSIGELVPELWLLARDGGAVRAAWPVDGCGITKTDARTALTRLSVLDDQRIPLTRYRPID